MPIMSGPSRAVTAGAMAASGAVWGAIMGAIVGPSDSNIIIVSGPCRAYALQAIRALSYQLQWCLHWLRLDDAEFDAYK